MKKIIAYSVLVIVLFFIGFFIAKQNANVLQTVKHTQILLGTVVDIQVRDYDLRKAENAVAEAFGEINRIDDLFSTFNEESPVWKINNSKDSILNINPEVYDLLILCDSITKISDGGFDVSLDNLTKCWGFYTDNPHLPEKTSIDWALNICGWKNVELLGSNRILKKKNIKFNFGAIAKGYAVDKAIDVLKKYEIREALVNAGGEINVIGSDWIVGIQHPRNENDMIARIKLENASVATSGDYEQYFEQNGVRYHHIINPATGYPSKGLQSVTIINKENKVADALATAVFVMGKEKGMRLIEQLSNTEAMIIDSNGKVFYSSGFKKFLIN